MGYDNATETTVLKQNYKVTIREDTDSRLSDSSVVTKLDISSTMAFSSSSAEIRFAFQFLLWHLVLLFHNSHSWKLQSIFICVFVYLLEYKLQEGRNLVQCA